MICRQRSAAKRRLYVYYRRIMYGILFVKKKVNIKIVTYKCGEAQAGTPAQRFSRCYKKRRKFELQDMS